MKSRVRLKINGQRNWWENRGQLQRRRNGLWNPNINEHFGNLNGHNDWCWKYLRRGFGKGWNEQYNITLSSTFSSTTASTESRSSWSSFTHSSSLLLTVQITKNNNINSHRTIWLYHHQHKMLKAMASKGRNNFCNSHTISQISADSYTCMI